MSKQEDINTTLQLHYKPKTEQIQIQLFILNQTKNQNSITKMENLLQQCQKYKQQGNAHLKANQFQKAVGSYTQAIDNAIRGTVGANKLAIYFANRSFANIKMENYGLAIPDAEQSVRLNPEYEKAYLRLAFCKEISQHFKDAYEAYKKAFEIGGKKDEFVYNKLVNCRKENDERRRIKKESLLHDDKQRGAKVEKLYKNWRQIQVQKQYTGPRLQQKQEVTSEWVVKLMQHYKDQKGLHKRYTLQLIEMCKEIVRKYDSLVDYKVEDEQEFTVCGDIHGQYYDVMNIFKINGNPAENNKYLFNGDFVDRGSFSVQCIMTLIAWKCANKEFLHMTRGNHEARQVNTVYGFKGQVEAKFKDNGVYEAFCQMFCSLPLVYVLNNKVMICHGGLPVSEDVKLKDIKQVKRFTQPPESGIMCDILWADPTPNFGRTPSKRGVSMGFGPDISQRFLINNGLQLLIRSHEVKQEGYEAQHNGRVVTIFSAPNYCDFTGNRAAFIRLRGNQMKPKYTQFDAVPHPNIGPMAYASQFRGMV